MRNLLVHETQANKLDKGIILPQDKAFMTEIYRLMESELSNSELNIQRITEALHLSRTKLYYKLKGLTGMNPNVFFKTYRLNRAAELLREGKLNISEIADLTGFSTLSHFSASFKEQFGISPSKYV
jgi:AraC-like DNA-binding protein